MGAGVEPSDRGFALSHKRRSHRQLAADRAIDGSLYDPISGGFVDSSPRGKSASVGSRTLVPVKFPGDLDSRPVEDAIIELVRGAQGRIQAFQDRWDQPQIEQFVASDFELVYRVLRWIVDERLMTGRRMLEWGCGFAVVAALGAKLGLDVTGIEAERRLLEQAKGTLQDFAVPVELVWGNFLPPGAEPLSPNPDFPSLGHEVPSAYAQMASDLDDFALVFGYPWPGEWVFHERVFARYGAKGGLLVLFYGPNDVRVFRNE